jgi:uncharacterized cupin superfamily protein
MSEARRRVTVKRPDEGTTVHIVGDTYRFLGVGAGTDSQYLIMEATVPPGGGPPPHLHTREEESFYVLDGEIDFEAEGHTLRAGPGSYLNMPKAVPHTFRNNTNRSARMLIICAPGGHRELLRRSERQRARGAGRDRGPLRHHDSAARLTRPAI